MFIEGEGENGQENEAVNEAPGAEDTQNGEAEGTEETEVEASGEGEQPAADGDEPSGEEQQRPSAAASDDDHWAVKRLAKVTRQNKELKRQLAAQAGLRQGSGETNEEFERRVDAAATQKAAQLAAQEKFKAGCDAANKAGYEAYGEKEFNEACDKIKQLVDFEDNDEASRYVGFVQACIDSGEGAKLFWTLAQDLSEAERILGLAPAAQGMALARLADKPAPEASNAPKPMKPVQGKGSSRVMTSAASADSDKLTTAEWMQRRNADIESGKSTARH